MINPNTYYTVQAWMVNDLGLHGNELAIYAIIYGFSQDGRSEFGGSISYIQEWLGCSKNTAKKAINGLVEKGLIKRKLSTNGVDTNSYRAVLKFANTSFATRSRNDPLPGQDLTPTGSNSDPLPGQILTGTGSNSDPNNYLDNNYLIIIKDIVEYLNKKAGKKYRASSKDTQKHIRARLEDGYTVADFQTVIDKMCGKWKGDPKMEDYLRPSTLFGPKFEGYLNASAAAPQPTHSPGRGGYRGNIGPNGIPIDPTKNDLDGLI